MRRLNWLLAGAMVMAWGMLADAAGEPGVAPDAKRVAEIATWVSPRPQCMGRPISDRVAWGALAGSRVAKGWVKDARKAMKEPTPDVPDDLYLEFSRTGQRRGYEAPYGARVARLDKFVLAECVENKGEFLPAIEKEMDAICSEKSWCMPAHDRSLMVFNGKGYDIDLGSSRRSWELGVAIQMLGDKLPAGLSKKVKDEILRRTIDPFMKRLRNGGRGAYWWVQGTNNWNAVCWAGTLGAGLAVIDSRDDRAYLIAAGERGIAKFISGFTPDGYCEEGLGYWGYGFGNFVEMAEMASAATGGRVDLCRDPKIASIATFAKRIEIINGVYPAFADCHLGTTPARWLMNWASHKYHLNWKQWEVEDPFEGFPGGLADIDLFAFRKATAAATTPPAAGANAALALRDWFPDLGILVCRPSGRDAMGAALKGGYNATSHNHNDVGNFIIALGNKTLVLDTGVKQYFGDTFGAKRYDYPTFNSYGHSVPLVAGKQQSPGRDRRAKVLEIKSSDAEERLVLDLRSAYDVSDLVELKRTFVFSRAGRGSLEVTDRVQFSSPESFGTALITLSPWSKSGADRLIIRDGDQTIEAQIRCDTGAVEIKDETLTDKHWGAKMTPTRIGINLGQKVTQASLTVRFSPVTK